MKGIYTSPTILSPQVSEKLSAIIEKGLKVNPSARISAAGIEAILGKKDASRVARIFSPKLPAKKLLTPIIAGITLLVISFILINKRDGIEKKQVDELSGKNNVVEDGRNKPSFEQREKTDNNAPGGTQNKIIINAPGISNAELVLNDGSRRALPYTVSGKEGDQFEFKIRANGYKEKEVQVVLTPRRISYEFNLEKNNP